MASGDVFRVALVMNYGNGSEVMCTFGLVEGSGGPTPNTRFNCAAAVSDALGADPLVGFSDTISLRKILVQDVQPGTAPMFQLDVNHPGGVAGAAVAPQDAVVCKWQTDLKGPANRGRMFIPGWFNTGEDSGFWTSDVLSPASAFVSRIFDPFGPEDGTAYQLNVLSYVPGSDPRSLRAAVPVTAFTLDNIVRSQRRRQVGVGR